MVSTNINSASVSLSCINIGHFLVEIKDFDNARILGSNWGHSTGRIQSNVSLIEVKSDFGSSKERSTQNKRSGLFSLSEQNQAFLLACF
jgi:hypothetical protein